MLTSYPATRSCESMPCLHIVGFLISALFIVRALASCAMLTNIHFHGLTNFLQSVDHTFGRERKIVDEAPFLKPNSSVYCMETDAIRIIFHVLPLKHSPRPGGYSTPVVHGYCLTCSPTLDSSRRESIMTMRMIAKALIVINTV